VPYTRAEFLEYYGEVEGRHEWNRAVVYVPEALDEREDEVEAVAEGEDAEGADAEGEDAEGEDEEGDAESAHPAIPEGFICPLCRHHLISPEALHSHFQTAHNDNR
jgi:hypothetical protein